jgi:SagB-type dehydrogenase family enzyme
MTTEASFRTAPLVAFVPRGEVARVEHPSGRRRYASLAPEVVAVLHHFASAQPLTTAIRAGLSARAVEACVNEGLIVPDGTVADYGLWEQRGWQRAAYFVFSQIDLEYSEPDPSDLELESLRRYRREEIAAKIAEAPYPPRWRPEDEGLVLPPPNETLAPEMGTLLERRSVRRFSRRPPSVEQLATVLWWATADVRSAEASRAAGDPYFLLNSFYSWLQVYVVINAVNGLDAGVFHYDPLAHTLTPLAARVHPSTLRSVVQGQPWVSGSGFAIFVAAQWSRYMWLYRHSRAYANLLIQVGEFGQELLLTGGRVGLGGWPTPAVHEGRAARMLGLPAGQEAIYMIRLGIPASPKRGP